MFDYQQKRKLRTAFESPIMWAILIIIIGLMTVSAFNRYQIASDMAQRRAEVEREVKKLNDRKEELDKEVEYLSNDRGIEAEMRRQFDVAKDGEQIVIILENNQEKSETHASATINTAEKEPWYKIW